MKKNLFSKVILLLIIISLFSCTKKDEGPKFIVDESGHKMYKDADGVFIRNDWYEINGDKYYFDGNGYLVTGKWVNGEYLVDDNGKMYRNYWHNQNGKLYYLNDEGKYLKNGIHEIEGKKYYFNKEGALITEEIVVDSNKKIRLADKRGVLLDKEGMYEVAGNEYYVGSDGYLLTDVWKNIDGDDKYFDSNGLRVVKGFAKLENNKTATASEVIKWCYIDNKDGDAKIVKNDWVEDIGKWYYADEDGVLLTKTWKTIDGDDYYFGEDCDMTVNDFVDGTYYVDENGKKVKNAEKNINGTNYAFDANGKANKKIIITTKNDNWKVATYNNSATKYVTGTRYYSTTFLNSEKTISYSTTKYNADLLFDKEYARIYFRNTSTKKDVDLYSDTIFITIEVNGNEVVSSDEIEYVDNKKYLVLTDSQRLILLNALMVNGNKIGISIVDCWGGSIGMDYYKFEFYSTGFNEVYAGI